MVYTYDGRERLFTGHSGRLFLLLTFIWLCVSLSTRLLPPLLPAIIDELVITSFLAGIALTGERIIRAIVEYPSGRAADRLSRTVVLVGCIGCVIVGLTILSVAFSYVIFLLGVLVLGFGRGMYSPASRALLSDIFREKRGRAFGINMMGSKFSGIFAAGIAILTVSIATWRAAFLPLAILLVPLLGALYLVSRESLEIQPMSFGLRETGRRVFGDSSFRWILIVYSLYVLAASGVSTFLPLFLLDVHDVSFALASSAFALLYASGIVAKPMAGFLSDVIPRLYIAGGSLVIGAGGLVVLIIAPIESIALVGVIIYVLGYRGLPPGLQAYLMDQFPDGSMAGDLGAMRTVYMLVGSMGPANAGFTATVVGFQATYTSFFFLYLIAAAMLLWAARM